MFHAFDPQGNVCQWFGATKNLLSTDEYDAFGVRLAQSPSGVGDVFGYGAQWGYQTDQGTELLLSHCGEPAMGGLTTFAPTAAAGR